MVMESFTLYAVTLLLAIALDATNNPALLIFPPIVTGTQVRDVFFCIFLTHYGLQGSLSNRSGVGHRSIPPHPASREQECFDERRYYLWGWEHWFDAIHDSERKGVDRR